MLFYYCGGMWLRDVVESVVASDSSGIVWRLPFLKKEDEAGATVSCLDRRNEWQDWDVGGGVTRLNPELESLPFFTELVEAETELLLLLRVGISSGWVCAWLTRCRAHLQCKTVQIKLLSSNKVFKSRVQEFMLIKVFSTLFSKFLIL